MLVKGATGVIFGLTNADDMSITFGPVETCDRDYDWRIHSLLHHLSYATTSNIF